MERASEPRMSRRLDREVVPAKVGCSYSGSSSMEDASFHEHTHEIDVSDRVLKLFEDYLEVFKLYVEKIRPAS